MLKSFKCSLEISQHCCWVISRHLSGKSKHFWKEFLVLLIKNSSINVYEEKCSKTSRIICQNDLKVS